MTSLPTPVRAALAALLLAVSSFAPAPASAQSANGQEELAPEEAGTGLVFEPEAVYRSFPATSTYRAFLPPSADTSRFLPPVGFQGSQSSCVGWATSYGLRSYYENRRRAGISATPTFSPAFVYNQIKSRNANCSVGTSISDALNLMKRVGTVPMSEFPYDSSNCSRLPGPDLASEARSFRIDDWKRVDVKRLDDVKGQLVAGNPVVIGMLVNSAFHKLRGNAIFEDEKTDGSGHAMLVVGYDDQRGAFKLFNSWGRNWGDKGFGWVDYETFQARTRSAFVMQVASGAAPVPAPVQPSRPPAYSPTPAPSPAPPPKPSPASIPVPRPPPAPVPAPQASDPRIESLFSDIPCSVLRAERGAGGRLTVRGVVGKAADRDRLAGLLREVAGVASAALEVEVMPWPQCEVRMTFAPAMDHAQGLSVGIRAGGGGRPVLKDGAPLVLDVTTPAFASYLYVIYLQVNGEAVFIHTPAMTAGRPWPAGSRVTIGDGSGGRSPLAISKPFGDEMILAIAAPTPLASANLPEIMTEREFLTLFRRTLSGHGARGVTQARANQATAAYAVLTTRAGPP